MKRAYLLAAVGLAAATLAVLVFGQITAEQNRSGFENDRRVPLGRDIYGRHCASCHGDKLEGQANWRQRKPDGKLPAPPHDETGHTWHHATEQLFRITKYGLKPPLAPEGYKSDMPAFGEVLSDEEIRAVLSFIGSTWPAKEKFHQERVNKMYEKMEKSEDAPASRRKK